MIYPCLIFWFIHIVSVISMEAFIYQLPQPLVLCLLLVKRSSCASDSQPMKWFVEHRRGINFLSDNKEKPGLLFYHHIFKLSRWISYYPHLKERFPLFRLALYHLFFHSMHQDLILLVKLLFFVSSTNKITYGN